MDDLIIVGAGPAGLTASIYASCFHLKHVVIGSTIGGQMLMAPDIINYPGFVEVSGRELTDRMLAQVRARGGSVAEESVISIAKDEEVFSVMTKGGARFQSSAVIIASGTERKKLNVPGENEYTGKGVHYCATCERQDYAGKVVAVVGGGNAAGQSALQLAHAASRVVIVCRGDALRCDPEWMTKLTAQANVVFLYTARVKEISGNGSHVTGITIDVSTGGEQVLDVEKVFIEIGGVPGTSLVTPLGVALDPGGYIKVDEHLSTSVPGVFAAGDLVSYGLSLEQISTAVGLGARAASSVFSYLKKTHAPSSWGQALISRVS